MKDWQSYFLEQTLDLGYSYFLEKCVHECAVEKQQLTAKITDDTEKNVMIVFDDTSRIMHTNCDCLCPSVEHCHHLAALLFEYETHFPKEYEQEIAKLIAYADDTQIQSFLTIILQENQRLMQRFHQHILLDKTADHTHSDTNITTYKNNSDCDNPSERVDLFVKEMILFTELHVKRSMKQKKILHGFEIVNAVINMIDFSAIDFSAQALKRLLTHCYASLKKLLHEASAIEKEELIQRLTAQVADPQRIYSNSYIHKLLNEKISSHSKSISLSYANKIQEKERSASPKRSLSVKQMEILDYSTSQIHHAVKENWSSPVARSQYVDYLQKKNAYTEAITVLKASIEIDNHSPDLILLHRYSLKRLYQKLDDKQGYTNQIYHLLVENSTVDMNLIHQLKKVCTPEEWEKCSIDLFEKLQNHVGVGLFYSQEKRYDLLLDYVLKAPGLEETSQYFIYLKKHAPDALLQKYEYELRKTAQPTGTRPLYHKIARLIIEMASLPNSMVSAQLLIKELKEKYPRRKALLEELKIVEKKL